MDLSLMSRLFLQKMCLLWRYMTSVQRRTNVETARGKLQHCQCLHKHKLMRPWYEPFFDRETIFKKQPLLGFILHLSYLHDNFDLHLKNCIKTQNRASVCNLIYTHFVCTLNCSKALCLHQNDLWKYSYLETHTVHLRHFFFFHYSFHKEIGI